MRTTHLIPFILACFSYLSASAQGSTSAGGKFQISDLYVQGGVFSERNSIGSQTEFMELAPGSNLLAQNYAGFTPYSGSYTTGSSYLSVQLGMNFRNPQTGNLRKNPQLRLGLTYHQTSPLMGGFYSWEQKPWDTLVSTQTGQQYYVDSVTSRDANFWYSGKQIKADASLLFRTNPARRWSLFAGLGLAAGFTFNAKTTIEYSTHRRTQAYYNPRSFIYFPYDPSDSESQTEEFSNRPSWVFSGSAPMGFDFRIGKKQAFWQKMHLFYELRPSFNLFGVPDLSTLSNLSLQQGIGLRVELK